MGNSMSLIKLTNWHPTTVRHLRRLKSFSSSKDWTLKYLASKSNTLRSRLRIRSNYCSGQSSSSAHVNYSSRSSRRFCVTRWPRKTLSVLLRARRHTNYHCRNWMNWDWSVEECTRQEKRWSTKLDSCVQIAKANTVSHLYSKRR